MAAKRIEWIDFCRVYAVFCVIVRHSDRYYGSFAYMWDLFNFRSLIFFFFLMSGYFTHQAEKNQYLDFRRTKRLLWPYLFWAAFAAFTMLPLLYMPEIQAGNWSWATPELLIREMGLCSWTYWDLSNVPLWFLRTLILLALFSPLLQKLPLKAMLCLILLCFAGSDVLSHADGEIAKYNHFKEVEWLPFRLYESVLALGFFSIGLLLRRYVDADKFTAFMRSYAWMPIVFSLILLAAIFNWKFFPPIMSSALVLLGVCTTLSIGCLVDRYLPRVCAFVAQAGKAAFFVYVTHYLLLKVIRVICTGQYRGSLSIEQASAAPIIIMAVSLGIYYLLRRFCPGFLRIFALS